MEELDGEPCFVIRGNDYLGLPADAWIGVKSVSLLRKIKKHSEYPDVMVVPTGV
jgi:hypothetical protein